MMVEPPTGMPEELGDEFSKIAESVVNLRVVLTIYSELFYHSGDRIQLLQKGTNGFFIFVQQLVIKEMIIHFSKLTDPARSGGFSNLSFYHIHGQIAFRHSSESTACLQKIEELKEGLNGVRTLRNKMIAHFDLLTAKTPIRIQSGLDHESLFLAIDRCEAIVNLFYCQYSQGPLPLKSIAGRIAVDGII